MQTITLSELTQDLVAWMTYDGTAIDFTRRLRGGESWEQWSVVQFLHWQLTTGGRTDLDYERDVRRGRRRGRRYDVVYNRDPSSAGANPVYTSWKCRDEGDDAAREIERDMDALAADLTAVQRDSPVPIVPLLVVLSPDDVAFPGVVVKSVPNCATRLHLSTDVTWKSRPLP
ncbi:hypothetical protein MF672_006800 [Actinomadura sp. ATCC 31491]|uniref:DUF1837 domain-containing protein n=1 Tax=Actinomadura luzonensis TaxID=2805427 RepID=A0ABT0FMJ3_9ACTN|nr:hypothetical protein [Actinomadura luzonensis]MCK2213502.1 hypothetical protein [Actinomadura luzonensis]